MGIGEIFWIFLMLSMLQPLLRQRMPESARFRLMRRLERQRSSRVILLVHRQETMGFLGFPLLRYIDINDAEEVIQAIRLTDPSVPIDLVLHTPGGLVLASLQIARALQAHQARVTVFASYYAMSGGTLIALAADEIIMDSHAVLGPVDPQLREYPAASLAKVVKAKDLNEVDDKTLIMADVADKALHQIRADIIHEVVALVQSEVRQNRVILQTELSAALPPVLGDRVQVQQVILNLLLNGIEAMYAIRVRPRQLLIRSERHGSDEVLVAVQDCGIGLDPQNIDQLFDAFVTTKPGGMGMGLSISRSITAAHGGRLWASANAGPGATFQFTLPTGVERVS